MSGIEHISMRFQLADIFLFTDWAIFVFQNREGKWFLNLFEIIRDIQRIEILVHFIIFIWWFGHRWVWTDLFLVGNILVALVCVHFGFYILDVWHFNLGGLFLIIVRKEYVMVGPQSVYLLLVYNWLPRAENWLLKLGVFVYFKLCGCYVRIC
jgi:hypothetical protein